MSNIYGPTATVSVLGIDKLTRLAYMVRYGVEWEDRERPYLGRYQVTLHPDYSVDTIEAVNHDQPRD